MAEGIMALFFSSFTIVTRLPSKMAAAVLLVPKSMPMPSIFFGCVEAPVRARVFSGGASVAGGRLLRDIIRFRSFGAEHWWLVAGKRHQFCFIQRTRRASVYIHYGHFEREFCFGQCTHLVKTLRFAKMSFMQVRRNLQRAVK